MESPKEIKHHKEIHSYYLFILIIAFTILVLQPVSMLAVSFLQAVSQI